MTRIQGKDIIRWGLAMLLLLAAPLALAGERGVERRVEADADGTVIIENITGSIVVEGWDREEVHITGTLGEDVEELKVKAGGRKTRIEVKYPRNQRNINDGADLVIRVPAGSRVEVECVSAPITVNGVSGPVYASSISGDVEVRGDSPIVTASTISGDVVVEGPARQISMESISGTVRAKGGNAEVEASVVNGRIDLAFDRFEDLDVGSVNGDVVIKGDIAKGGEIEIEVHSGTVTLTVPSSVSADWQIDTFNGNIDNGFGQKARRTSEYAPGKELEFTTGDGDARVRINTFNGSVVIKKRK
jgi:DUF4097 and DUF4098 domain-containing protein YvlB